MAKISSDPEKARYWLNRGEVVAIPTETVYGLAARSDNPEAIQKIFKIKNRPLTNPLIVHIGEFEHISKYAANIDPLSIRLIEKFWPGPLTILLPVKSEIDRTITAGHSKIALRMPSHPLTLNLLKSMNIGLVAPSANPSNYISPTSPLHVNQTLGSQLKFILDGGSCENGIESTIVEANGKTIYIYRNGSVTAEMLSKFGKVSFIQNESSQKMQTPGSSKKHYSPVTPLILASQIREEAINRSDRKLVIIAFTRMKACIHPVYYMSESGNLEEAAHNIYRLLYDADKLTSEEIIVEMLPESGIGMAINDRLRRAAAKKY